MTIAEIYEINTREHRMEYQAASDFVENYFETNPRVINSLEQLVLDLSNAGEVSEDAVETAVLRLLEDGRLSWA